MAQRVGGVKRLKISCNFPILLRFDGIRRCSFSRNRKRKLRIVSQKWKLNDIDTNDEATQNVENFSSPPKPSPLIAELSKKSTTTGGKRPVAAVPSKHVRRANSGKHMRERKDGAGGKATWGRLLDSDVDCCLDKNDPNYDSGEEASEALVDLNVSDPLDDYKGSLAMHSWRMIYIGRSGVWFPYTTVKRLWWELENSMNAGRMLEQC